MTGILFFAKTGAFPEEKLFNNVYDNPIISGRYSL